MEKLTSRVLMDTIDDVVLCRQQKELFWQTDRKSILLTKLNVILQSLYSFVMESKLCLENIIIDSYLCAAHYFDHSILYQKILRTKNSKNRNNTLIIGK